MKKFKLKLHNQKGFTLIELIVVIAILGILVGIAVPKFGGFTQKAKFRADEANIKILNDATNLYALKENTDLTDITVDILGENGAKLADDTGVQYLESTPIPQSKKAEYLWNQEHGMWVLSISNAYGFQNYLTTNKDNVNAFIKSGDWDTDEKGITNGNGGKRLLFFPKDITAESYKVITRAILDKNGATNAYGYGIVFDASLNNNNADKDLSYIFQFDPGINKDAEKGEFIFKKRTYKNGKSNEERISHSGIITDFDWTDEYDIELTVTKDNNKKNINVSIKDMDGNEKWNTKQTIKSNSSSGKVGLRTWGKSNTEFTNFDVIDPSNGSSLIY